MYPIKVAARDSPLSQVQVEEVLKELKVFYPEVSFEITLLKTTGDLDQKTSLMRLDKTDFFTKEIDQLVLQGICDVGVHSAKDLPDPLPQGLELYALTKGVDSSDSLVLRDGETIQSLCMGAKIGTSSLRRISMLKAYREDLMPVDIRGNIQRRLELLENKELDALIIAEAALIRLGLTHLNRMLLKGEVAPLQGKLAVIGRNENQLVKEFFKKIHEGV
jgi:hydroxymethylbilane synthase